MGLFEPKWKSVDQKTSNQKKIDKALAEVRNITDQQMLKQIVLEALHPLVRNEALEHISDPAVLMELIRGENPIIAQNAVDRINDQNLLKEIALEKPELAGAAAGRITDPAILISLIGSDADIDAVKLAIRKINDPDALKKAFLESGRPDVQKEIWMKLPITYAREIAEAWQIPEEEMCGKVGAHCDAPGPVLEHFEQNFDEGATSYELRCCELCGRPQYFRSKKSAVWYSWGEWNYIDPLRYQKWNCRGYQWFDILV